MLNGLDDVDWKKRHAENVPIWIRQLTSPNEEVRFNARAELGKQILCEDNNLQGIRIKRLNQVLDSDIHVVIIPFFVELLTFETVGNKEQILSALHFMAEYVDYFDKNHRFFGRTKAIRDAVWIHHDSYFMSLNHGEEEVKLAAVRLLSEYTEHTDYILPRLLVFLESPLDIDTKAEVLWEINDNLLQDSKLDARLRSEFCELLERLIKADQNSAVRTTATVILINLLGEATPPEAIAYLVDTMINPMEWSSLASTVLALVVTVQARTITKLGLQKGLPAAIQVMDKTQSVENCFHAFVAALILAFSADSVPNDYGVIPSYQMSKLRHYTVSLPDAYEISDFHHSTLNASQEAIIEAAIRNDCVWSVTSNVFDIFGIPSQREELKTLLS
ncbi:MAG: hypothetical protein K8L99_20350 [Anaerolineae bacterium]|nr:hypothetical protein [Anaerolineae bacterium]